MSKPVSRVLSRTIIYLRDTLLRRFSHQPERTPGRLNSFLYGVAPGGVYMADMSPYPR